MRVDGKLELCCAWCEHRTHDASEAAAHMVSTGHGLSPEIAKAMRDSGEFADLVQMLEEVQRNPECGTPVDDDDLPELIREKAKEIGDE